MATNLTSGLTSLSAYVANGGMSLTEEAWAGIDLLELRAVRDGGRLVADDALGLAAFLDSGGGRALWRGNAACVAQAQEILRAVAVERVVAAAADRFGERQCAVPTRRAVPAGERPARVLPDLQLVAV
ncbi:hypothetical protein, partial [uncultured Microbacterium sp.]|uniref:hypothetical protein n=1 Tax=uncultured Microbacterium sp. TaxID=191216 RepID=UPI0025E6024F